MTPSEYLPSQAALEAAAHALWRNRNTIPLEEVPEDEREAAWANALSDAEAALIAGHEAEDTNG